MPGRLENLAEETPAAELGGTRARAWFASLRPRHWIKNGVCLLGLVFSGRLLRLDAVVGASIAFLGFCLASSGIYLLNDIIDRDRDRLHPMKRYRPIAAGAISARSAGVAAVVLLLLAGMSSSLLPPICRAVLAIYVLLNLAYSSGLKHRVLVDVLLIAFGFVLRVLYGVYAVEVKPTSWIVLCIFFLALFLGFAKRRRELGDARDVGGDLRPVLSKYRSDYLDLLLAMTATMAILCYALYTVTGRPGNATLVVTVPLVVYGIIRYLLLVLLHGVGAEPERHLVSDKILLAAAGLWLGLCAAVIYSDVNLFER